MLKIKDNINLKELEKFGFGNNPYSEYLRYYNGNEDSYMWIDKTTRKIDYRYFWASKLLSSIEPPTMMLKRLTTKLIKAGFVEKVEGKSK